MGGLFYIMRSFKMTTISVIIPTFNRHQTIRRALLSVKQQTLPATEIIVVDDGSTDQTAEIVQKEFPDVVYIFQKNKGVSSARNKGIIQASGEWIAFLDSDDEWLPQKLERQMAALQKAPRYRLCHTEEIWIRRGKRVNPRKIHQKHGGYIFEYCLPRCVISPSSVIIHRDIFKDYGLFDESLPAAEDYDLWLRICAFEPVLFIQDPLIIKYGGHDDQLSRKYWGLDRYRIYALEKLLYTGRLSLSQEKLLLEELIRKLDIVIGGAQKRGNREMVNRYAEKRKKYAAQLKRYLGNSKPHNPSLK